MNDLKQREVNKPKTAKLLCNRNRQEIQDDLDLSNIARKASECTSAKELDEYIEQYKEALCDKTDKRGTLNSLMELRNLI